VSGPLACAANRLHAGVAPGIARFRRGERLDEGGGVLGVFATQTFHAGVAELRRGDRVVLYTDGVTEASNAADEEFGEERLLQVLQDNRESSAQELQKNILRAASDFCSGTWRDDATLLVLAVL